MVRGRVGNRAKALTMLKGRSETAARGSGAGRRWIEAETARLGGKSSELWGGVSRRGERYRGLGEMHGGKGGEDREEVARGWSWWGEYVKSTGSE